MEASLATIKLYEKRPENNLSGATDATLILAHGAGAPADSDFMDCLSKALAREGVKTVRFEFPYMQRAREDGRKRPPDRQPTLLAYFREVIEQVSRAAGGRIFIGGKSMGGRMASLLAAEPELAGILGGCICFGYPFHPSGKSERWRIEHFDRFHCPVLIIQGTRDPFGRKGEVLAQQAVADSGCTIHWLVGGEHDFRPLAKQPETQLQLIDEAARATSGFVRG